MSMAADAVVSALIGAFGPGELRPLPLAQSAFIVVVAGALVLGPNDSIKAHLTRRAIEKVWRSSRLDTPEIGLTG